MMKRLFCATAWACAATAVLAQGPPPARVVVGEVREGLLAPTSEFKGTVYFKEVSELATEVGGKVLEVRFEEGSRVSEGDVLVRLDAVLLQAELRAAQAAFQQGEAQLAQEQARLERTEPLLRDRVTTPQVFDDVRYTVESFRHQVAARSAEVERIQEELKRKTIRAPFDGIVVARQTEVGEWKQEGDAIAVIAREDLFDVVVNIPQEHLNWVQTGDEVTMEIQGRPIVGAVAAVVPRGDVATRTFPVKVRVTDQPWLLEGMSALVGMPAGSETACLLVPRDAVLLQQGENLVYYAENNAAVRLPVSVVGYDGQEAGIHADGLETGTQIIVKGHERLRDGQAIEVSS
jgi:RND family efflux transporter MFP subunit